MFQTSLLELIANPLKKLKIVNDTWPGGARQAYIYEHIFAPVVFAAYIEPLTLYGSNWVLLGVFGFFHVFVKEFIVDKNTHAVVNWANVIERSYGMMLAVQVLMF